MGLSRSTFYDTAPIPLDADGLLARIGAICDECECYGYRRLGTALRHEGVVVNGKKLRRLMREHGLQPKRRRRFVVTTDSDHGGPIYPDLAKGVVPNRPNQLPRAAGVDQASVLVLLLFPSAALFLNLKLSFPISRMWQWWVSRSSSAVVILVSPNTSVCPCFGPGDL